MHNFDDISERIDPNFTIPKDATECKHKKQKSSGSCNDDYPCNKMELKNMVSYSDDLLQNQRQNNDNPEMDSIRSGESIIKNYIFDNTKYNPNTSKCISFWRALKERPDIKPCPCEFKIENPSLYTFANQTTESLESFGPNITWYDVLQELQQRKMDQVAFAATFQSCRLCERDEPYAKFKRKMGQNYSDTELRDDEDITCLNCWTSYSKAAEEAARKKENEDNMTKVIFMGSTCVCEKAKKQCTCIMKDGEATEGSDQDSTETAYVSQNFNRTGSESGEGDSMNVTGQKAAGKLTKERVSLHFHNLRRFQNMENPSDELSSIIVEDGEGEHEQEIEVCECQICEVAVCENERDNCERLSLVEEDPSLSVFNPTPSKSPAEMIHPKYKPGCCYNCGILGCVCNICAPPIQTPPKVPKAPISNTKTVKIETFEKFLNQCELCGMDCKCWKNKVDHAKNYLEDLKKILKENVTYDKACGMQEEEEDTTASTKSENICIICGHRSCNCKTSHGRPSLYFQSIEFGPTFPEMTTFAKISQEKNRMEEARSRGTHEVKRQPSDNRVNMEKLKTMRMKHQPEQPIIKDCKNKYMVTPAQKAKSIIKNNINLVINEDLYGIPHVTRYPDKRPIVKPNEDTESYPSLSDSSDETEIVHGLEPWYCTERPKEEEPEITYGRKL